MSLEPFYPQVTLSALETQLAALREKLSSAKTLIVEPNEHGIYAASEGQNSKSSSGYQNAWLRDNVMVAFSKWTCGDAESAFKTVSGLTTFLQTQATRMDAIIREPKEKEDVNKRPHVRFNPQTLEEIGQSWAHAQNDALGYVLWLRFRLANEAGFNLSSAEREFYTLLVRYLSAIQYWQDKDSGAWEESRKLNSSSVGAVVAGLSEVRKYLRTGDSSFGLTSEQLTDLISFGDRTLELQLPFEAPPERRTDAALLFLIYPLGIVTNPETKRLILSLVRARLLGSCGIRRYIGDSYYCQDYDKWFPPEARSADFSNRIDLRDEFLRPGCEAQWCLFDPLLSVIYSAENVQQMSQGNALQVQLEHFNRSISQIDSKGRCPELYYLKHDGYVPNEHSPLAWTQANLAIALYYLEQTSRLVPTASSHASLF